MRLLLLLVTALTVFSATHSWAEVEPAPPPGCVWVATGFPELDATVPWTVQADDAGLYRAPSLEAELVRPLEVGETFLGRVVRVEESDEEWLHIEQEDGSIVYTANAWIHRVHPANRVEGDLVIGEEIINRWWGIPIEYEPSDLVVLPGELALRSQREYRLRREAAEALVRMLEAARTDGIDIRVVSAYRSGPTQQRIYASNIGRRGFRQRSSAPPGHSEHQLGTTLDLTDSLGEHVLRGSFGETPEGAWLRENGVRFGFVQSYTPPLVTITGYIVEPWHWRYWGSPEKAAEVLAERADEVRESPGEPRSMELFPPE